MLLKIGEFARLGSVSPRTLRHYEDVGLLTPVQVDPVTGYRAYQPDQLARLNRIVALKDLGLSLAQVAQLLDGVTAEQIHGMLALRRMQLEDAIDVQQAQLARVEARLRQIEREGTMSIDDIVRKHIPSVQVIAIGGPVSQIVNEDLLPVLNRAEEQFDTLRIRKLLGGSSDPFVTYYTEDPEGEFHAYLTLAAPDIPDPLPRAGGGDDPSRSGGGGGRPQGKGRRRVPAGRRRYPPLGRGSGLRVLRAPPRRGPQERHLNRRRR